MLKFSFAGNPNKSGTVVLDTQQVLIYLFKSSLDLGLLWGTKCTSPVEAQKR